MFRMGLRVAEWATPHVKEIHTAKNFSRTEGARHCKAGNWAEAEKHLTQGLEQETHAPMHQVQMMLDLALAQRNQFKLQAARTTAEAAVELAQQLNGKFLISDSLEALADVQMTEQDHEGALASLSQAAGLTGSASKEEMTRKAKILRKQGAVLMACGLREESRQVLERALKLAEKVYGPQHVETAHALSEMGALYRDAGEHEAAQTALRRALTIYRDDAGIDSGDATKGLQNLARSLEASGHYDAAIEEYERVLAARERQLGSSRVTTAEIEARLALLYVNAGKIAPARELLAHAIGVLERAGGHAFLLALETLVVADEISGRHAEAARNRAKLGRLSPETESVQAS